MNVVDNCTFMKYLWDTNMQGRRDCTSALKPSSSGTSALHTMRENKDDRVMMIWAQSSLDAFFFMTLGCLWSPVARTELRRDEEDRKQPHKFLQQAGEQDEVLLGLFSSGPLIFNHKPPQQVSYLLSFGAGASETWKNNNKVYHANKKVRSQTLGEKNESIWN